MYTITHGNQTVKIDPRGAFITNYRVGKLDILMPKQEIDGKIRGGVHVCAPNFGPGGTSDQPQHGYGRVEDWLVDSQTENKISLVHTQTAGDYAGLVSRLDYSLDDEGLEMALTVDNQTDQNMRLSPGFHPYFNGQHEVVIDGQTVQADELDEAKFYQAGAKLAADFGKFKAEVCSGELKTYALWTASPDKYICVEPTLAGNSFAENSGDENEFLAPSTQKTYRVKIKPYL